jgi:hypothetical protein
MMAIIGYTEPMTGKTANKMDLINEAFVLFFTYHLYQFTDFMTDLEARSLVGTSLQYVAISNIGLNIGAVILMMISVILRKLKLVYLAFKQRREIRKQFERNERRAKVRANKLESKMNE